SIPLPRNGSQSIESRSVPRKYRSRKRPNKEDSRTPLLREGNNILDGQDSKSAVRNRRFVTSLATSRGVPHSQSTQPSFNRQQLDTDVLAVSNSTPIMDAERFLSNTLSILAASSDLRATIESLVRLGVGNLSECCGVFMFENEQTIRRLAIAFRSNP